MKDKTPVEQLVLELCFCIPKKGCTSLVAGTSLFTDIFNWQYQKNGFFRIYKKTNHDFDDRN